MEAQLVQSLPSSHKALGSTLSQHELGWKHLEERQDADIQSHPRPCSKLKAHLGYMRSCFRKQSP